MSSIEKVYHWKMSEEQPFATAPATSDEPTTNPPESILSRAQTICPQSGIPAPDSLPVVGDVRATSGSVIGSRTISANPRRCTTVPVSMPLSQSPKTKEELLEDQSQWLNEIFLQNPQFLAMRERALPLAGGYSFSNVTHAMTVSSLSCLDRHDVLELIYQHLQSIGMHRTAEILSLESGHTFQSSSQPWDRTDLHLLTSLAVGHREDAWNLPPDPHHKFVDEVFEEDFLASPYREDPAQLMEEFYDPNLHVIYEDDSSRSLKNIKACSLKRFVVYFATQKMLNNEECQMFFLSMHSITSASHFLEHLVTLYDAPIDLEKSPDKDLAVRVHMNIVNFITKWTACHIGKRTLNLVTRFLERKSLEETDQKNLACVTAALKRIQEAQNPRKFLEEIGEKVSDPIIPEANRDILFKMSLGILEPEPLELARQITLIAHEKYASVHSLELIVGISKRKTTIQTPTLNEFFEFGDSLIYMMAEAFINAANRSDAYKRILEVAKSLDELNNKDGVSCLLTLLRRPDIKQIANMTREDAQQIEPIIEDLWMRAGEKDKELPHPTPYEKFVDSQFDHWSVMIPNMHVELERGEPTGHQPDFIDGLINWAKIRPHADRCVTLNRFQTQCRYNFVVIPQIRKVILRGPEMTHAQIEEKLAESQKA